MLRSVLAVALCSLSCGRAVADGARAHTRATPRAIVLRSYELIPDPHLAEVARGELRLALQELGRTGLTFATGSYALGPKAQARLAEAAKALREHEDIDIYVIGHTDERGHPKYNRGLAYRRAHAVVAHLARFGVDWNRMVVVSLGEDRPQRAGHDPSAWAANRRVSVQLRRGHVRLLASVPNAPRAGS